MDDKDRVFARLKGDKSTASERREMLTIPRRAGVPGIRVVEVVHVRSGGAIKDSPRRYDTHVRAASWDAGFPAKQAAAAPALVETVVVDRPKPTAHVMRAWEPVPVDLEIAAPARVAEPNEATRREVASRVGKAHQPARCVADPFDANDDGANCIRCGYAIEPAWEKRGLMTCSECG